MLLCLQRASVEFVLVGAHALAAHGIARATGDIDIFVRPSPDNAVRVVQALVDFGVPIAAHNIGTHDFTVPGTVHQIGLPPRRIDLLTEISGGGARCRIAYAELAGDSSRGVSRDAYTRLGKVPAGIWRPRKSHTIALSAGGSSMNGQCPRPASVCSSQRVNNPAIAEAWATGA